MVVVGNRSQGKRRWGSVIRLDFVSEEEHNARARRICLQLGPRINKEVAVNCSRIDEARACNRQKKMDSLPFIVLASLLVVTVRAAWYSFRRCKKRP